METAASSLGDGDAAAAPCAFPSTFSPAFIEYCVHNGITPEVYQRIPWSTIRSLRYVRVRDYALPTAALTALQDVGGASRVPWLPCHAFRIPRSAALHPRAEYQSGAWSCMDAASMASVVALQLCYGDSVLDLCCCPGMKLTLIADALKQQRRHEAASSASRGAAGPEEQSVKGVVVGVDISPTRLAVARSLLKKHQLDSVVSLACCDGTRFSMEGMLAMLARAADSQRLTEPAQKKAVSERWKRFLNYDARRRKRARERDEQQQQPSNLEGSSCAPCSSDSSPSCWVTVSDALLHRLGSARGGAEAPFLQFDKVLVDAECTHDGSLFHLPDWDSSPAAEADRERQATTAPLGGVSNARRMDRINLGNITTNDNETQRQPGDSIPELQLRLLRRGFALLKDGGRLVYSTCSFSEAQNEGVVRAFLREVNAAETPANGEEPACKSVPAFPLACHLPSSGEEPCGDSEVVPLLRLDAETHDALLQVATVSKEALEIPWSDGCTEAACCPPMTTMCMETVRFWPQHSLTSFQFVAAFQKARRTTKEQGAAATTSR